jgi:hypothetical protein
MQYVHSGRKASFGATSASIIDNEVYLVHSSHITTSQANTDATVPYTKTWLTVWSISLHCFPFRTVAMFYCHCDLTTNSEYIRAANNYERQGILLFHQQIAPPTSTQLCFSTRLLPIRLLRLRNKLSGKLGRQLTHPRPPPKVCNRETRLLPREYQPAELESNTLHLFPSLVVR